MRKTGIHTFRGFCDFYVNASYVEMTRSDPSNVFDPHVHPEYEIYVNLSGDVSFMVGNRIYPILPGAVIISRPYEYHHCIYHSDRLHRHIWMLFTPPAFNDGGNLLWRLSEKLDKHGNLLYLAEEQSAEFISICKKFSEGTPGEAEKYADFFRMICLIEGASVGKTEEPQVTDDVDDVLNYINANFTDDITVRQLADMAHISVNTLERKFRKKIGMPPMTYIKKKRLARAAELLFCGKSVIDACLQSGFSDYSHFIALFKSAYGTTPLKYRSQHSGAV